MLTMLTATTTHVGTKLIIVNLGHILRLLTLILVVWVTLFGTHIARMQSIVSDGKIAFASNQDGDYEIYIMDTNGSNIQQLTHNETDDLWPDWSPDPYVPQ